MSLRSFLFLCKHKRACRELQRIVEANKKAPATREYVRRRTAALKSTRPQVAQ